MGDYINDYSTLRFRAEQAKKAIPESNAYRYFMTACEPATIITLIDELEKLQEDERMKDKIE